MHSIKQTSRTYKIGAKQKGAEMPTNRKTMPTTWPEIDRALGDKRSLTLCNNTTANRLDDGSVRIHLHGRPIVEMGEWGMMVSDAGWCTVTTYDRLKRFVAPYGATVSRAGGIGRIRYADGTVYSLSSFWRPVG